MPQPLLLTASTVMEVQVLDAVVVLDVVGVDFQLVEDVKKLLQEVMLLLLKMFLFTQLKRNSGDM